ncbi:MAG: hypothetical protein LC637_13960, partial [Xanthomonadaceae bacterium]|nr:hypothetical protein [Xanthomonadaceae bacterium]
MPATGSISTPPECNYSEFQSGCMNLSAAWVADCKTDPNSPTSNPIFLPYVIGIFVRRQDQAVAESVFIDSFPKIADNPTGFISRTTAMLAAGEAVVDNHAAGYVIELRTPATEVCLDGSGTIGPRSTTSSTIDNFPELLASTSVSGVVDELSGAIDVPQFPCTLPGPVADNRCETDLVLTGSGTATFCLWRHTGGTAPGLVSCSSEPNRMVTWNFTTLAGTHFDYRAHAGTPANTLAGFEQGVSLDGVFVQATRGSISLPVETCTIAAEDELCNIALDWEADNAPEAQIVAFADGQLQTSVQPPQSPAVVAIDERAWTFDLVWSGQTGAPVLDSVGPISANVTSCNTPPSGPLLQSPVGTLPAGTDPVA